jgi:dTDP-4-dehydrorhamnose reductase
MKILVTGAYGQLGKELKELSVNYPGWEFLFTDVDTLDISDEKAVGLFIQQHQPDFLINCAAYTAVDKAETETQVALKINAVAPGILARITKMQKIGFIHISTDYVFDGHSYTPYTEIDTVNPQGAYGKTKLAGEHLIKGGNPDALIIRTSWLYSVYGNNFVHTMLRLGKERDTLNVVFDQVGTPTYAADLAAVILEVVRQYEAGARKIPPGVYHYSNEGVASWYDFAKTIFELAEVPVRVVPILTKEFPSPAKRPHYSILNKSKIKATFNIEIPFWKDSLKICLNKLKVQ